MATKTYRWVCLSCGTASDPVKLLDQQNVPTDAVDLHCTHCGSKTVHRADGAPERRTAKRNT
jgi:hypothetical protein